MNKFITEIQENTIKQMKKINETVQEEKRGIETIRKTQTEATMEIEDLGNRKKNYRDKHHQQNTKDETTDLRHRRIQ